MRDKVRTMGGFIDHRCWLIYGQCPVEGANKYLLRHQTTSLDNTAAGY